MKLGYLKLHENAILPTQAHDDDLGIDLYALDTVVLAPNKVTKLRTGIAIQFPSRIGGIIKDRSSVATKKELFTVAGVIDPSYTGEIIIAMYNPSNHVNKRVDAGEKIAQLVLATSLLIEKEEITEIHTTQRGSSGFGSTGT